MFNSIPSFGLVVFGGCSFRISVLISLVLLFSGCATTKNFSTTSALVPQDAQLEIVLMPLDVELSVLTAGGLLEPRADWTESAKEHMLNAILKEQESRGSKLILYKDPVDGGELVQRFAEISRLHSAVGQSILAHQYSNSPLPTKKDNFSWTLGPDITALRQKYDADYALFIYVRDSYSSAGRVAVQILAAAAGIGVMGGQQLGFASLVDLRNGDIIWFNRLISGTGDLRTEVPAGKSVASLLKGLPD